MSDLVPARSAMPDIMTLGTVFARSGYFQDARDQAQAVVKMLAGQELGFGPVASMTGIYIVKGRVTLSANLLAAAVKRGGKYNYRVLELTEAVCKLDFYEGKEKIGESSFTMEDAKAAGLVNENYKKFARNMLFARAMSNGCKWHCPDVGGGGPVYTPDELGATIDAETGEMLDRPADETIPPAPPVETPEQVAARLFPDEPGEDRNTLIGRIQGAAAKKKLSAEERRALWAQHVGTATPETADLAALTDLLGAINAK